MGAKGEWRKSLRLTKSVEEVHGDNVLQVDFFLVEANIKLRSRETEEDEEGKSFRAGEGLL